MKLTRRTAMGLLGGTAATALLPGGGAKAQGQVHEVRMLNQHPDNNERMVFHPDIVEAQPGDTIRFVSVDPAHNSVTYDDMLPDGAEGWQTGMSQDAEVVVEAEGAYGYYCQPHRALGMVGLILVGDASTNYAELKDASLRGREQQRWDDIFARADEIVGA
jgi:pseudoazurin